MCYLVIGKDGRHGRNIEFTTVVYGNTADMTPVRIANIIVTSKKNVWWFLDVTLLGLFIRRGKILKGAQK